MNYKLLYALSLFVIMPMQNAMAMDNDNLSKEEIDKRASLRFRLDTGNQLSDARKKTIEEFYKTAGKLNTTDYAIVKTKEVNEYNWPKKFGMIVRKNKDVKDAVEDVKNKDFILTDKNIYVLKSWQREYNDALNWAEEIKKRDQPEGRDLLVIKGIFTTLWPVGACYGFFYKLYPYLPRAGTLLDHLVTVGVTGVGIVSFFSIYYGLKKLNVAWNYKSYKNGQDEKIKDYNSRITSIKSDFLEPLNEGLRKVGLAIDDEHAIILKENEFIKD